MLCQYIIFHYFPGGGFANGVIIHIHGNDNRVSKNLKELSFNSNLNITLPAMPPYVSIKDDIDFQYAAFGALAPHSATVFSSDFLQIN